MVVFTCGHCGESVQKPKVEKHYLTKCRNRNPNLSCMDCFKDFLGQDYEVHTKCITEEERYSGKGFTPKERKGEKKQNTWVEMLQSVLDEQPNAPANVRKIIEAITKFQNTPRKKPKFVNFVKNVCGSKTHPRDIDQTWDLISVKLSALSNANNQNRNQNKTNDSNTNGKVEEKSAVKDNDFAEKEEEGKSDLEGKENNSDEKENDNNLQNGCSELQNGKEEPIDEKKMTRKQRKEEKRRKKYEAELESVVVAPNEAEEEVTDTSKKGKKKKNRTESTSKVDAEEAPHAESKKQKKRKRQDTVNGVNEVNENKVLSVETEVVIKEGKIQKKKPKVDGSKEAEESVCLHDQNVANGEEVIASSGKFNWHAVILSVLEKKDNEVPFKRLQKKVLGEYAEFTGCDVDDRIADKFIKKLKSAPNVRVDKNRVLLIE